MLLPFLALPKHCNISRKESIDLVMTDTRMSEMTGFLFARKVKDLSPDMRIILISAFEINKGELDKVMPSTHINGFLTKPFHVAELVEATRSVDSAQCQRGVPSCS